MNISGFLAYLLYILETDHRAIAGVIYAFNTDVQPAAQQKLKDTTGVKVKNYNIIYELIDDIKQELLERVPTQQEPEVIGER